MTATPAEADVLHGWGISARLRPSWEGRLFLRSSPQADYSSPSARAAAPGSPEGGGHGWAGERTTPVLHLANFPLPARRGDFGTGATERMSARHAFVALLAFGPDEVGTALFSPTGMPRPAPTDFSPDALQQRLAGLLGYQRFFTLEGRPMCLYAVLGSVARLRPLCDEVNDAIDGIEVS